MGKKIKAERSVRYSVCYVVHWFVYSSIQFSVYSSVRHFIGDSVQGVVWNSPQNFVRDPIWITIERLIRRE